MKLSNEIKVGIFVLATVIVIFSGYNFLKGSDMISNVQKFYVYYQNIDGLGISNEVQINGFKVGKVQSMQIVPERNNMILVRFDIDRKIKIYKNTVFKINQVPLSNTVVSLQNIDTKEMANSGDTLKGESTASILSQFTEEIAPIKQRAITVMESMDTILAQFSDMMNKGGNKGFRSAFSEIQLTIHNLKETSESMNTMVKGSSERLNSIIKNVDEITANLKNNNAVISNALKNINQITDDVSKSNLKQTIENTNKTMADLSVIVNKIKTGEGSIGLLVNDDKLYNNLKSSSANLDKLVIDLKANPKRYVHFSIFGGKSTK